LGETYKKKSSTQGFGERGQRRLKKINQTVGVTPKGDLSPHPLEKKRRKKGPKVGTGGKPPVQPSLLAKGKVNLFVKTAQNKGSGKPKGNETRLKGKK